MSCMVLVVVVVFFLKIGRRYKVFSEKSIRPPGPLVTDSKQRDSRLKKGESYFELFFKYSIIYYCNLPLDLWS